LYGTLLGLVGFAVAQVGSVSVESAKKVVAFCLERFQFCFRCVAFVEADNDIVDEFFQ